MPTIDDAIADLSVDETIEGEVAFTAYFVDQDPIDGGSACAATRSEGSESNVFVTSEENHDRADL